MSAEEKAATAAAIEKSKINYLRQGLQNKNTVEHDNSASRLWVIWRRNKDLPKTPTKEELEGDGAEASVLEFTTFALSRPIPVYFDDNLQPTTQSNRCVVGTTLVGYIGKYLKKLREIYPDHPQWVNLKPEQSPPWWTSLRETILKRSHENQIDWQGQYEFGASDIRPLYLDLEAVDGSKPLQFCDLKNVIIALIKNANPSNKNIEMAAKIIMAYDSIARGGEIKFQNFTDWSFDYLTFVLDTQWKETKTCDTYAMARVADKRWWFCFFFIMGAYAMCSNGLYRSEEQIKNGLQYAVFPDLHKYSDSYITTLVGRYMKAGIEGMKKEVPGINDDVKKKFSAKSCRIGAVNQLALHPLITVFNVCARSGHSVGESVNALQSYLDRSNPLLGLPAALALHGYKCIRPKKVVYPKIEAVGQVNMASMKRLIGEMFLISISQFEENGELREVTEIFAASLILHYKQIKRDCGATNQIASKLEACAEEAHITFAGRPHLTPIAVLEQYCDVIAKKLADDIKLSEMGDEANSKGSTEMTQLVDIASDVKDIKANERDLMADHATTREALERSKQEVQSLKDENAQLRELLQKANNKLALVQSQSSPVRLLKRQHDDESEAGDNSGNVLDFVDNDIGSGDYAAKKPPPVAEKPPHHKKPRNTNKSESFNERTGDKGHELADAVESLAKGKFVHLGKSLASIPIPKTVVENKGHLTHCLALIDFAGPQDDIDKLSKERRSESMGEDRETEALYSIAVRLVNSARDKLFEFEGTTYEIAQQTGNAPGTTVVGMGARVLKYRNKIKEVLGLTVGPIKVDLMEKSELNEAEKNKAAPKNPTVLDNFLVRRSSNNSTNNE